MQSCFVGKGETTIWIEARAARLSDAGACGILACGSDNGTGTPGCICHGYR